MPQYCTECGRENNDKAKFCASCGEKLSAILEFANLSTDNFPGWLIQASEDL